MKYIIYCTLFLMAMVGCQNESAPATESGDTKETKTSETASPAPTKGKYTLTPAGEGTAYPNAELEYYHYKDGRFFFNMENGDYFLRDQTPDAPKRECANSADGQHIHLVIDNEPYVAGYAENFEHLVPDGKHYMMAFLSRSYHESIKTEKAYTALKLMVRDHTAYATSKIKEPMLFYSRPKGTYKGKDTKKVLLDFYLWEADISGAYKVLLEINDEEKYILDKWQAYFIEGLPMGENKIKLSLVYNSGELVDTKFNPVERVITLEK